MIVFQQTNIAAFAGNHRIYWGLQPVTQFRISATSAGPTVTLIAQARAVSRFVESRVFGRVN